MTYSLFMLAVGFIITSLGVVHKYTGVTGVLIYSSITLTLLPVTYRWAYKHFVSKLSLSRTIFWFLVTLGTLFILFFVMQPYTGGGIPGRGSDTNECVAIAAHRLIHWQYPYYAQTYLHNRIDAGPGQVLLAVPFEIFSATAFQNFFWMALFFFVWGRTLKDYRPVLTVFWAMILFCPEMFRQVVVAETRLTNALQVAVFASLLLEQSDKLDNKIKRIFWVALFLGLSLSSRMNYLLITPILFAFLYRSHGKKQVFQLSAIVFMAFALITLPFYYFDPLNFWPFINQNIFSKLNRYHHFLGSLPLVIFAFLSIVLAWSPLSKTKKNTYYAMALQQAAPIAAILVGYYLCGKGISWTRFSYGFNFLLFLICGHFELWRCQNKSRTLLFKNS